jgi:hypothetical protein
MGDRYGLMKGQALQALLGGYQVVCMHVYIIEFESEPSGAHVNLA